MSTALIDGDLLVFQICAAAEYGRMPDEVNLEEVYRGIESKVFNVMNGAGCTDFRLFFSEGNFRHFIAGDYKSNRANNWRPECLKDAVTFSKLFLNGETQYGLEADDLLTINDGVICTIDKDAKQKDGEHYRWEYTSHGRVIPAERFQVTEGWRSLYYQGLIGDSTDGIIGCGRKEASVYKSGAKKGQSYERRKGVGPKEAEAIIQDCSSEKEAVEAVFSQYAKIFPVNPQVKMTQQMNLVHMIREFDGTYAKLWHGEWMNPATGTYRMDG